MSTEQDVEKHGSAVPALTGTSSVLEGLEGSLRGKTASLGSQLRAFANLRAFTTLIGLIGIAIVFHVLTNGILISPRNIVNLARQISITGILAVGMTFILLAGDIDLSVASGVTLITVAVAIPQVWWRWGVFPAVLVALGVGVAIGVWHGYWVVRRRIPAFIVTLAGMSAYRGMALLWSKGQGVAPTRQTFNWLAHGYLSSTVTGIVLLFVFAFYIASTVRGRKAKARYGYATPSLRVEAGKTGLVLAGLYVVYFISFSYEGFPIPGVVLTVVAVAGAFVTRRTTFGHSTRSVATRKRHA